MNSICTISIRKHSQPARPTANKRGRMKWQRRKQLRTSITKKQNFQNARSTHHVSPLSLASAAHSYPILQILWVRNTTRGSPNRTHTTTTCQFVWHLSFLPPFRCWRAVGGESTVRSIVAHLLWPQEASPSSKISTSWDRSGPQASPGTKQKWTSCSTETLAGPHPPVSIGHTSKLEFTYWLVFSFVNQCVHKYF